MSDRMVRRFGDAFGTPISDSTTNLLDIGSHYPYSPERWRVRVDGTRVFPEYDTVTQYTHTGPDHAITPAQGETVAFYTAERPRYVVSYELAVSFALNISRLLQPGDSVRAGLWDGSDGWYIEQTGDQDKDVVTLVVEEDGTRIKERTVDLWRTLAFFSRFELLTSWYRIGAQAWRQTYTEDGATENRDLGTTSVEPKGGPGVGNLPFRAEITRGPDTPAITLYVGSVGIKNLGRSTPFVRVKTFDVRLETGTAGDWVPLMALRKAADREIVNLQVTDLRILEYTGNGDVQVVLRAHDPSKVLDGDGDPIPDVDYYSPVEMSPTGSVVQQAYTVAQAPDGTGTPVASVTPPANQVAPTNSERLGGYQVGYAALFASGGGRRAPRRTSAIQQKRSVFNGDVAVLWVSAENANEDLVIEITTEQDW